MVLYICHRYQHLAHLLEIFLTIVSLCFLFRRQEGCIFFFICLINDEETRCGTIVAYLTLALSSPALGPAG